MKFPKKEFINPARVFIAILIVVMVWFAPIAKTPEPANPVAIREKPELISVSQVNTVFGIPAAGACSPACERRRCEEWVDCEGPNERPMQCCAAWGEVFCQCGNGGGGGGGGNQPPTITHILTCSQNGNNGWCVGNLTLDLTASDPQGQTLVISGDVDGAPFICPAGNTCSVPVPEGAGTANYKVDSATGLSASGTTNYLSDTSTPYLDGSVSGVVGANGWYQSNVTFTVASSDSVSGIASTILTIDGGPQTTYQSPIIFSDGIHSVTIATTDNAGLVTQATQSFSIDTLTPTLNVSLSGTTGLNSWYVSNVTLTASASDAGSGLASLEAAVDGGAWSIVSGPLSFADGIHTYNFRATDSAGNITESGDTLNIDTTTPTLNISTTGVAGLNGWYVSNTDVTPTVSDATSGIASFEVTIDNGAWATAISDQPITFSDGIHSYTFKATDHAGNVTESTQTVKVDTVTPSLSLNISGTRGQNDWYTSSTNVTPTATDATSGIASLQVTIDDGPWTTAISGQPLAFSDGVHTYQYKVTDNAGNVTETPIQTLRVDTIPPAIAMDGELKLGHTLYYDLEDMGSGLWIHRSVIEDDEEDYKKLTWEEAISGNKAQGEILWDGKFADGEQAGIGEYFITLKISDAAGNERMQTAIVKVGLLSFLEEIPAFTPPVSSLLPSGAGVEGADEGSLFFGGANIPVTGATTSESNSAGGANNGAAGDESASISAGGTVVFNNETEYVQSGFTQGNETTSTPTTNLNILWGAVATAALGATLADWQRKREEEQARKRTEAPAQEKKGGSGKKTPGQRAYEKKMKQKRIVGESQALLNEKAREKEEQAEKARQNLIARNEDRAPVDMAKVNQLVEQAASQQARDDHRAGERGYAVYQAEEKAKPTWWEKTVDWVDKHQVEISLGIGLVVGIGAIILSGGTATPLVAAAWIAGAAVAAGGTVALGTVGLNAYYDRPLATNVVRNLALAGGTAAVLTGAGFILPNILQGVGSYCALNTNVCSKVEPVLNAFDTVEEVWLTGKGAYQTWIGDSQGAADTAIELQMEHMDGGMPGNAVIAELGGEALELIQKYGDDVLPLVLKYGDDAIDIIGAYGDEGIALLLKYGDKTDEAIALVKEFGTPAVELLDIVDPTSADTLLKTLDGDVLDYAMQQGPEAVAALSRWSENELREFGPELALRAEKDAKVLKALNSLVDLGSVDPKHLTDEQEALIKIIAENSTQYSDEGQIVLGKWVDYGNGFTNVARETGSAHYNPHPDMWKLLEDLGNEQRESAAWLVNKQVIQTGIDKGLPFEYTLDGIIPDNLSNEMDAIEVLWSGADDINILRALNEADRQDIPIRMKELKELHNAGYQLSYDVATNSYILVKP